MQKLYVATEKFDPSDGDVWDDYINWRSLTQLIEVIGLDSMLNTPVLDMKDSYWSHILNEHLMPVYFTDLAFLRSEVSEQQRINLIGTIRAPSSDVSELSWDGFRFHGYELLDQDHTTSALTNCGDGFPESFRNDELSERGLIVDFDRAVEIQRDLKRLNPREYHADTNIWAVFRSSDTEAS